MTTAVSLAQKINRQRRTRREQQGIKGLIDGPLVAAHLQACIDAGWTRLEIANVTHVSERGIRYILNGQPTVQRDNATRLLAVRPEHSPRVPPIGCIRRIRALSRAGYTVAWTGQQAGCSHRHIYEILNGTVTLVDRGLAERFAEIYRRHEGTPGPSNPARIAAKSKGWDGPEAWDEDTIDDPDAVPDWTGFCGTDRGWWTHRIQHIPVCQPCEDAHTEWREQHKGLPQEERFRAVGKARASASTREADLAADAREIKRLTGADDEQAAARLGVTRQHLQQALKRHPASAEDQQLAA